MTPLPSLLDYPIIAVGDLHGQLGFLDGLLARLREHPEWPRLRFVFLGDLVDRGPDVKGTVRRVLEVIAEKPGSTCVLGNHDLACVMAAGLGGVRSAYWSERWRKDYDHGPTFASYLGREPDPTDAAAWPGHLDSLREAIPAEHRNFLANLPWVAEAEGHVFLHNGLSPELDEPAEVQLELLRRKRWHGYVTPRVGTKTAAEYKPEYPVWFGADKNLSESPLPLTGRVQVTGHRLTETPDANPARIRIDTSGGKKEPLTGCLLRGPSDPPEFVSSS